jgi:cytochrome P450
MKSSTETLLTVTPESFDWATATGFLLVVTVAAVLWAYQSSDQKRIESSLEKQGIRGQFEWSLPFLGRVAQFLHPERLDLAQFDRPDIPRLEYLTLFGTPLLVIADPDLTTEFWRTAMDWAKSPMFYQLMDVLFGTSHKTIITAPSVQDKRWHGKREVVGQSFRRKETMADLANFIEIKVEEMCDDWCDRGTAIDVDVELTTLTLQVVVYFIFGLDISTQDDIAPLSNSLGYMIEFAWALNTNPFNGIKSMIPGTKAYQASREFRTYVKNLIDQVKQQQQNETTTSTTKVGQQQQQQQQPQHLIHALLAQTQWSQEVLENEVMSLIFAGHDTTAHATTIALDNCLKHPHVIQEIRKEYQQFLTEKQQQNTRFDDDDDDQQNHDPTATTTIPMKELHSKMKWPTAAFKESLRLNPETPGGTIRVAPKDTPIGKYGEYVIPKGCAVLCPMWIYSHSEQNWGPDAKEFTPQRFLDKQNNNNNNNISYPRTFISFSQGRRNCVGMPLAYMEGSMLLGYILTQLDITVESPLKKVFSITLRANDFVIGVKRNKNAQVRNNNE